MLNLYMLILINNNIYTNPHLILLLRTKYLLIFYICLTDIIKFGYVFWKIP